MACTACGRPLDKEKETAVSEARADEDGIVNTNLCEDYCPSWGPAEGVRELLQNWYDEVMRQATGHHVDVSPLTGLPSGTSEYAASVGTKTHELKLHRAEHTLILTNPDAALPRSDSLENGSTKSSKAIGQFGEGMKTGICALLRKGVEVEVLTGQEKWSFEFQRDPRWPGDGKRTLVAVINASPRPDADTLIVKLVRLNPSHFSSIQDKYLFLRPPDAKQTFQASNGCTILFQPSDCGLVYAKGVRISKYCDKDLAVGFDDVKLLVGRDRNRVEPSEYVGRYMSAWSDLLASDDGHLHVAKLWRALQTDASVEARFSGDLDTVARDALAKHFFRSTSKDVIILEQWADGQEGKAQTAKMLGHGYVFLNESLYTLLAPLPSILSIDKVLMDRVRLAMFAPRSTENPGEQRALQHLFRKSLRADSQYRLHFIKKPAAFDSESSFYASASRLPGCSLPALHVVPAFQPGSHGRVVLVADEEAGDGRWSAAKIDDHPLPPDQECTAHWIDGRGEIDVKQDEISLLPTGAETMDDFASGDQVLAMWNDQMRDSAMAWYRGKVVRKSSDEVVIQWSAKDRAAGWADTAFKPNELTKLSKIYTAQKQGVQIYCNLSNFTVEWAHQKNGTCVRPDSEPCLCHLYDATSMAFEMLEPGDNSQLMRVRRLQFFASVTKELEECKKIISSTRRGSVSDVAMRARKTDEQPAPEPAGWPRDVQFSSALIFPGSKDLSKNHTIQKQMDGVKILKCPADHKCKGELGLFARRAFEPDQVLGHYAGKVLLEQDFPSQSSDDELTKYVFDFVEEEGCFIDAKTVGNEARFVNDYRGIASTPNAEFVESSLPSTGQKVIYLVVTQHMQAGVEILVDYGEKYWKGRPEWESMRPSRKRKANSGEPTMPASSYAINTVKCGGDGNRWEVVVDDYSRFEWKKVVLSIRNQPNYADYINSDDETE